MARAWHAHAQKDRQWSPGYAEKVMRHLELHIFPWIGPLTIIQSSPPSLCAACVASRSAATWKRHSASGRPFSTSSNTLSTWSAGAGKELREQPYGRTSVSTSPPLCCHYRSAEAGAVAARHAGLQRKYHYAAKSNPAIVRQALGPQTPWLSEDMKLPAPRVTWTSMVGLLASGTESPPADSAPPAEPLPGGPTPPPALPPAAPSQEAAPAPAVVAPTVDAGSTTMVVAHVGAPISFGGHLAALVAEKSRGADGAEDERAAWAEEVTAKLRVALNGYGLQAAVKGTRLRPNGCLVKLAGSDRLRVED